MRVKRVVLEHHRDVPLLRLQRVHDTIPDPDLAFGDRLEAGGHTERGRLSAPGGADEDHELAVVDVKVEVDEGTRAVRVHLARAGEDDVGHG